MPLLPVIADVAPHVVMKWTWTWTNPISADFGDNPVFDWIRVACVVEAMCLVMAVGRVLIEQARRHEQMPMTQRMRFVALLIAAVSMALTEVAVVGTPATPRLFVNMLCLAAGTYGVGGIRRKQRSMPVVRDLELPPRPRRRP